MAYQADTVGGQSLMMFTTMFHSCVTSLIDRECMPISIDKNKPSSDLLKESDVSLHIL